MNRPQRSESWTVKQVADRFHEAALTAHRLPPARVQGYFNSWPALDRQSWEGYADEKIILRIRPSPAALDRFDETVRWLHWLGEEQRHLVWWRAAYLPWREICARLGRDRKTAWRHWQHALALITVQLNHAPPHFSLQSSRAEARLENEFRPSRVNAVT